MTYLNNTEPETAILVVTDSLRADTARTELDCLASLADTNVTYSDAHAPGASTPSSMPGIVQSRLPIDHRGYGLTLPPDVPTLAEQLTDDGVRCAAWHSNVYVGAEYGFDRGFETYADLLHDDGTGSEDDGNGDDGASVRDVLREVTDALGVRSQAERAFEQIKRHGLVDANPKVRAERLVDRCLDWLPDRPDGQRRFAWLHLMDTHLPYFPPEEHRRRADAPVESRVVYDLWKMLIESPEELTSEEVARLRRLYVGEAMYVDDQLSRLVSSLRERDLWEDAAVVFTADHGELFRDREVSYEENLKHPDYLCEELTHVPLVVAGGPLPNHDVTRLASGLDVAPTVASLLGIDRPEAWVGTVLESQAFREREHVVSALAHAYGNGTGARVEREALHVAVRSAERALLWWLDDGRPTEHYRRTPDGEQLVRASDEFDEERTIAERTAEQYVDVGEFGDTGGQVSRRLKDLGYVD